MMNSVLCFVILSVVSFAKVGYAVSINRTNDATFLTFEGDDLLRLDVSGFSEDGWLAKDIGHRRGCYVQTVPFEIPFQAKFEATVYYQAHWRAGIDEVDDISEIELARFDLSYERTSGKSSRESGYILTRDLDSVNWIGRSMDFIYASAKTLEEKPLHVKATIIPKASKNIRVKMCGIAPFTSLLVSKVEIKLSEIDDFITASNFNSENFLHCYDTGLFLSKCSLSKQNFAKSEHAVIKYKVEMEFDCEGHEVDFHLETDTSKVRLQPQKGRQEILLEGKQLELIDANPKKTLKATFNHGCVFKIYTVEKSILESQRREFEKRRTDLEDLRNNFSLSAKAFADLNNLAQVMVALKASLKLMNYQARSENETRTIIQGILKGMEENANGDVWETILYKNSLLKKEEKSEILKLRNILRKILADKTAFHEVSFENMLSSVQLDFLSNALENNKSVLENDKNYDHFKKLEEKAKQDLRQVWLESKDFLDWELKDEI